MRFVPMFALLTLATPAIAQDAPAAAPQAEKPVDKMVCRRAAQTGSIMGGKKVCHTKAEWAKLDGNGQREIRDNQRELSNNNRMPIDRSN